MPMIAVASHHSSHAYFKSYIGKVANRLKNQATINKGQNNDVTLHIRALHIRAMLHIRAIYRHCFLE